MDTIESLQKELAVAYDLITEILPVTLSALLSRKVKIDLDDQEAFWARIFEMQTYVDIGWDEAGGLMGDMDNPTCIFSRIIELRDATRPQPPNSQP